MHRSVFEARRSRVSADFAGVRAAQHRLASLARGFAEGCAARGVAIVGQPATRFTPAPTPARLISCVRKSYPLEIDYALAGMVTGAAVLGSFIGAAAAGMVPQDVLRRGFAWFVVVMAVFLLAQELPRAFGYDVALATDWPWIVGLLALPLVGGGVDLTRMSVRARQTATAS